MFNRHVRFVATELYLCLGGNVVSIETEENIAMLIFTEMYVVCWKVVFSILFNFRNVHAKSIV